MPGWTRSLRACFFGAFLRAGMLLGIAGLAAISVENLSFGHAHLAVVHAIHHHHHLYFGAHEHAPSQPGPDHSDQDAPAPQDRATPRRTATVSVTPALFQPVGTSLLAVPLLESTLLLLALALPLATSLLPRPTRPRGPPPALITPPGPRREKGTPRCRP